MAINNRNFFYHTNVFTALGIRFWDPILDKQVIDDLVVTARLEKKMSPVITSFRTASGIYAFQGLPGLHDMEYPVQGETNIINRKSFIIEVRDRRKQFLTTVFKVNLPLPYEGIYPNTAYNSPLEESLPGFYLFSAPTRSSSPGLAVVRGQLIESVTENPAAYAVLEVQVKDRTWYGVADERGCIAVLFPYPAINGMFLASPPVSIYQQNWEIVIRVRYDPEVLIFPYGSDFPELRSIWSQSSGIIIPSEGNPPVAEFSYNLFFGQEVILQTEGQSGSVLFINKGD